LLLRTIPIPPYLMRQLILLLIAFVACQAQAQTYFYVNDISVIPEQATIEDEVSIHVFGDLSNTASYIVSHEVSVSGTTVSLDINCESGFGAAVLVPFDTIFPVGMLPAGNYTIELGGNFTGDFVISILKPNINEATLHTIF